MNAVVCKEGQALLIGEFDLDGMVSHSLKLCRSHQGPWKIGTYRLSNIVLRSGDDDQANGRRVEVRPPDGRVGEIGRARLIDLGGVRELVTQLRGVSRADASEKLTGDGDIRAG